MNMTVHSIKVGSRFMFGRYGVKNENPRPVIWLKADEDCRMITEDAIDYICFDAKEPQNENIRIRYIGNCQYKLSNLLCLLNSDGEQWYRPAHQTDAPPSVRNTNRWEEYENHYGFLYHFEDYEIESILPDSITIGGEAVTSLIRLPIAEEILGPRCFKLFRRKGIRPKASEDMNLNRGHTRLSNNSYVDFWLADYISPDNGSREGYASIISRSGSVDIKNPAESSGVRPVCRLKGDTPAILADDGIYRIQPYQVKQNIFTEDELMNFLGIK